MKVECLGVEPCFTPACGFNPETKELGLAIVVQIGRIRLQVCQRCGGHKPTRYPEAKWEPER